MARPQRQRAIGSLGDDGGKGDGIEHAPASLGRGARTWQEGRETRRALAIPTVHELIAQ
jgi:hypothetical protein